jgi:nitrite reductase (NADH) large subunit
MKEKLVLIGNGMAGMRTIDELFKLAPDKYDITVFGSEPHGNYNRIMLSPVLAGDKTIDDIITHDIDWYKQNNITLHTEATVTKIDRVNKQVKTDCGINVDYDKLILATGSNPFMLPLPGADLDGVISFRDIKDVNEMIATAKSHKKAVVIGGGLLGLEAANGLRIQGMDVTVVHRSDTLMNMQLDKQAADLMKHELEASGLTLLMEHETEVLLGEDRVEKVRFSDGTEVEADLVVMAVGIRPNKKLAEASGISCDRGILVDDTLQSYTPGIYAVGECVQHRNETFGFVAPLYEQARVCANHLAEFGIASYKTKATAFKLKVTGINLFSAGDFLGDDTTESLVYRDLSRYVYKKIVLKDNKVHGIVLYGDTQDGNWYYNMLNDERDVSDIREDMLFGQQFVDEELR